MRPSKPSQLARRRRRTWPGLVALAALFFGFATEAVHAVFEAHTWCEVHAALEHCAGPGALDVSDSTGEVAPASRNARPASKDPSGVARLARKADGEEHSRCRLVALSRDDEFAFRALLEVAVEPATMVERVRAWPGNPRVPSIARLRLAPKHSPPAV